MSITSTSVNLRQETKAQRRGCLFYVRRGLAALVILIIALSVTGMISQSLLAANDARRYPPPGQIVSIGDYALHIQCMGEGSPTIILEAGGGFTSGSWAWILPEVAKTQRVCAYDRAGWGWSEPSPVGYGSVQNAVELHTLLRNSGIEPPYVLVGHSLGGLYARVYAHAYPEDVVGLVQVDASHPDAWVRRGQREGASADPGMLQIGPMAARFGLLRLMGFSPVDHDLPERQQEEMRAFFATTQFAEAALQLDQAFPQILEEARDVTSLGDLPLVILTTAEVDAAAAPDQQVLRTMQQELAALSSDSQYRVVEGATHNSLVHNYRHAQAVIDAISAILEAARTGSLLAR